MRIACHVTCQTYRLTICLILSSISADRSSPLCGRWTPILCTCIRCAHVDLNTRLYVHKYASARVIICTWSSWDHGHFTTSRGCFTSRFFPPPDLGAFWPEEDEASEFFAASYSVYMRMSSSASLSSSSCLSRRWISAREGADTTCVRAFVCLVNMCTCVCVYIYICILYILTYVCACVCMCVRVYVCMYVCIHVWVYMHLT